jgi:hypothetical protein
MTTAVAEPIPVADVDERYERVLIERCIESPLNPRKTFDAAKTRADGQRAREGRRRAARRAAG